VEIQRPAGLMRGMLHLPERSRFRPPWPGVALFHGFTSQRMGFGFLFLSFSRLFAEAGIAGVRFDFMGCGESDGRFEDLTLSSEIEDAGCVLYFLRGRREVDDRRLFLLGMSMGGTIAGFLAGVRPTEARGLLLWAAAGERARLESRSVRQVTELTTVQVVRPSDIPFLAHKGRRMSQESIDPVHPGFYAGCATEIWIRLSFL
jgi:pimeloyl-ACP methyl ester carboxylesterase